MSKKVTPPYHFVPLPQSTLKAEPSKVSRTSHSSYEKDHYSGEMLCEIETLTPAIFGAFQSTLSGILEEQVKTRFPSTYSTKKSVILPQQIKKEDRTLSVINGSTLMGVARQEMAAISFAPMTRVQEKSFSYRPNATFPEIKKRNNRKLKYEKFAASIFCNNDKVLSVDIYPGLNTVDIEHKFDSSYIEFDHYSHTDRKGYLSKLFSLQNKKRASPKVKDKAYVPESMLQGSVRKVISEQVIRQFEVTTKHLCNDESGHLSSSNPMMKEELFRDLKINKQKIKDSIRQNRDLKNWPEGLLIFVDAEIDDDGEPLNIVSFGNNFRYHWSYNNTTTMLLATDTKTSVRKRLQVQPLACELQAKPSELSMVSSVFGMIAETDGNHKQAGKIAFNHAVEVEDEAPTTAEQGLWAALAQSGQPKPSAYEYYFSQHPKRPIKWPGDPLPPQLAGRKYYLHQDGFKNSFEQKTQKSRGYIHNSDCLKDPNSAFAKDIVPTNKRFRFSSRFRNLSRFELGGVLLSLSPHLIKDALAKSRFEELQNLSKQCNYPLASKLGYGRPQGYGSVKITVHKINAGDETRQVDQTALVVHYLDTLIQRAKNSDEKHASNQLILALKQWIKVHSIVPGFVASYREKDDEIYNYHKDIRDYVCKERRYGELGTGERGNLNDVKLPTLWEQEAK